MSVFNVMYIILSTFLLLRIMINIMMENRIAVLNRRRQSFYTLHYIYILQHYLSTSSVPTVTYTIVNFEYVYYWETYAR